MDSGRRVAIEDLFKKAIHDRAQGARKDAAAATREALELAEAEWGSDDEHLIPLLELHADVIRIQQHGVLDDAAVAPLQRALAIAERVLGATHEKVAALSGQAGMALHRAGLLEPARDALLRAVAISEHGGASDNAIFFTRPLAAVLMELDPPAALPYYEKLAAHDGRESPGGTVHFASTFALGECLVRVGRNADAIAVLEDAREMLRKVSGENHRWIHDIDGLLQAARK